MPEKRANDYENSLEEKSALAWVTWEGFMEKVTFKWDLKEVEGFW